MDKNWGNGRESVPNAIKDAMEDGLNSSPLADD